MIQDRGRHLLFAAGGGGPAALDPGYSYVNWSAGLELLVPPFVLTVTSTVPEAPGGAVAVSEPSSFTVKAAAIPPKSTSVASARSVPVIVTECKEEPKLTLWQKIKKYF